jgi:hypothetical protein
VIAAPTRQTVVGLALIGMFMSTAIAIQRARDRAYPLAEINDRTLYLTSADAVGRMALGFKTLAADLYWMRALQHFGDVQRGHRINGVADIEAARREYDSLYPLLDLTTSLDPMFNLAYRFGSIFLSEKPPAGPGRPDLAVKLLEKGLRARPDRWEYMHDIGYVHYWWDHDYIKAAEAFRKASEMPGAPWWLKSLAATTLATGGDRRSSRTIFTAMLQSAEIDWMRHDAERRLLQLDALDTIDVLEALTERYRQRTGAIPADWSALVRAGLLRGIPVDPAGTPYVLGPDGRVQLAAESRLWPLPEEPRATKSAAPPPS